METGGVGRMAVVLPTIIFNRKEVAMGYKVEKSIAGDGTECPTTEMIEITDGWWVTRVLTAYREEDEWNLCDDNGPGGRKTVNRTTYLVVGPGPTEEILLSQHRDSRHSYGYKRSSRFSSLLLVGDQPFGAVQQEFEDGQMVGGQYFACARQIHKSELGRRPLIRRPRFAREAPTSDAVVSFSTGRPISTRNRRRGENGWARVAEVAKLARMNPGDMLAAFMPFTDTEHPHLDLLLDREAKDIIGRVIRTKDITRFSADQLNSLRALEPATAWMRKGLALTILYLRYFDYTPAPIAKEPATAV